MSGALDERSRLSQQVTEARSSLDRLLAQREAALDGAGPAPHPKNIDRARARLEAAEALLRAHERTSA